MVKALMGRREHTQEQMGSAIREVEILRKNEKTCSESKTWTEMEDALQNQPGWG